jgi:hypothetical protein
MLKGSNSLSEITLGLEEYNPVYLNPFRAFPTVALLIYITGKNFPRLDILMDTYGRLCFYAVVC